MAKCLTCGTVNSEDNIYCAKCGIQLVGAAKSASAAAYEEAQRQFEKDALVGMNKDKVVYTCILCGTVNRIENEVCSKCGKRRPRNEFVNALKRVQEGRAAQEELANAPKAEAVADAKLPEPKAAEVLPALPEEPQEPQKLALYKFVEEPKQLPQTIQPLVIVPYVNADQPLWQYKPNQLYRFQPSSYEERIASEANIYASQNGKPPTKEELLRLQAKVAKDLQALDNTNPAKVTYNKDKKKVRAWSFISIIAAIASIVMFFVTSLSSTLSDLKGMGYAAALGACIKGAFNKDLGLGATSYAYQNAASFVVPLGAIIVFIISVIILIFSIIRLFTGRARTKSIVLPLIALVIAIATAVTMLAVSPFGFGDISGFFGDIQVGFYALLAAPLVMLIAGIACPKNSKSR